MSFHDNDTEIKLQQNLELQVTNFGNIPFATQVSLLRLVFISRRHSATVGDVRFTTVGEHRKQAVFIIAVGR